MPLGHLLTSDGHLMSITAYGRYYHNESASICENEYGANLVSIPSTQHFNEYFNAIAKLCDDGIGGCCWIGINVDKSSCSDENYVLNWTDNTPINQSLINSMWCDGYPLDLCHNTTIYFDDQFNCLKNADRLEIDGTPYTCRVICGNPYINTNSRAMQESVT